MSAVTDLADSLHRARCWRGPQCDLYGPEDVNEARRLLADRRCENCGEAFTYADWLDRHDTEDGPVHAACCERAECVA